MGYDLLLQMVWVGSVIYDDDRDNPLTERIRTTDTSHATNTKDAAKRDIKAHGPTAEKMNQAR